MDNILFTGLTKNLTPPDNKFLKFWTHVVAIVIILPWQLPKLDGPIDVPNTTKENVYMGDIPTNHTFCNEWIMFGLFSGGS